MVKVKEVDVKNLTCYFYDNIKTIEDFDFDNILIKEKTIRNLTLHNDFTILIKSVFNKNKNNYHYNIFWEKGLYELAKKNSSK